VGGTDPRSTLTTRGNGSPVEDPHAGRPLTIVAVDDDLGDAELLRRHLEAIPDWSFHLLAFADAEEALAALPRCRADILLLDYLLGPRTGLDLLREITQSGPDLPVIFLTGHGDEDVAVQAMHAGAADYLPKSALSPASLRRSISNAVEKHKLRQSLEDHRRRLEQTNRDLLRRNQELQGFAHVLSHELKTPLTSIREFLAIILDGLAGDLTPDQRSYLTLASASCDHMVQCINDLLDLARLETGKLALDRAEVPIRRLLDRVIALLLPLAERKCVTLRWTVEPDALSALLDEGRMAQALTNLLANALKFTPPGGEVILRAADRDSESILLSVADSGPGIAPRDRDHIFDHLYQGDHADANAEPGIGLGLHICREIVKLHGGDIWVESPPGSGATFHLTIPKTTPAPSAPQVRSHHEEDPHR
jgi:signal transduction histidine kinase